MYGGMALEHKNYRNHVALLQSDQRGFSTPVCVCVCLCACVCACMLCLCVCACACACVCGGGVRVLAASESLK